MIKKILILAILGGLGYVGYLVWQNLTPQEKDVVAKKALYRIFSEHGGTIRLHPARPNPTAGMTQVRLDLPTAMRADVRPQPVMEVREVNSQTSAV